MSQNGGRYKMMDNEIVDKNPDGSIKRIRFKAVSAISTPSYMEDLITSYNVLINEHKIDPLLVVPLTILDFLCIHPFSDGNGRISRLMTLLLLYHFGYTEVNILVSKGYLKNQRKPIMKPWKQVRKIGIRENMIHILG